jgi:hypothetical protein
MNSPGSAGEDGQAIRPAQLALVLLFVVVFAAKLGLAWRFPGFLTGDDLEIVETAGHYAWGLEYEPWTLRLPGCETLARDRFFTPSSGFLAGGFLFVGLFDYLTWGSPFRSLREFIRIMAIDRVEYFGVAREQAQRQPVYYYLARLLFWMPPLYLLLTALGLRDRRIRAPILLMTSIVVLLSLSPNKSLRYLQAAIPFLALSAALGWERLASMPRRRWLAVGALVLAVPLGLRRFVALA